MAGGILGSIIGAALPGVLPTVTETAKILVERLVPDPTARAQAQRELEEVITARETALITAIQEQNKAQNEINLAQAQSPSIFVSGWRPAVSWVCVFGMAYSFIMAPMLGWLFAIVGVALDIAIPVPPTLDNASLMALLTGLLGLSGLRTVELAQGVAAPNLSAPLPKPTARR